MLGVELRAVDGAALPSFEPGAHVDVHLPGDLVRQYSLSSDAIETGRYCLGVGRAGASGGGSRYIHEQLREGDRLTIGEPRALFTLAPDAQRHRFIAGGIGITPILSMIRWCERHAKPWELHYCVRSRAHAAYLGELSAFGERVRLHVDDEAHALPHDVRAMVSGGQSGEHVYCCGPGGLMDAVLLHGEQAGVPRSRLHFERFTAPAKSREANAGAGAEGAFTVLLARQGVRCVVEPGESILGSLERHGVRPPFSCREGLCRSCEVPLLSGEVEHRDYVLSDEERSENKSLMICVSRARSGELVIDV
ncbi:PDR/VanB family oxidoreductase [Trinickia terrae]|uniref:PDR/VanB family oxidoreductase n=1 Tax=Trinickia terrae TaxID=2571161 RepID=UPI0034E2DD8A